MTYIQANFCNSMVDMDLFFLQICATQLPAHTFLSTAIDVFGVSDWLSLSSMSTSTASATQDAEQNAMMEGLLTFLATLVTSRTNLGNTEPTQCMIEIAALLATGDKTHSQLLELMPERSGNAHTRNFEHFLKELSVFRRPNIGSENLDQGLFIPVPEVWEKFYDPLHVLLRAVHRRDFQNSMDRYTNYVREDNRLPKSGTLWPPFRLPAAVGFGYSDPACLLQSRVLHSMLLSVLFRAVTLNNVSEHMLALAVFLLEMAVSTTQDHTENMATVIEACPKRNANSRANSEADQHDDAPELLQCYPGDCLTENLRHRIARISLPPTEPQVWPAQYNTSPFDSDSNWDSQMLDTVNDIQRDALMVVLRDENFGLMTEDDASASSGLELAVPEDRLRRHRSDSSDESEDGTLNDSQMIVRRNTDIQREALMLVRRNIRTGDGGSAMEPSTDLQLVLPQDLSVVREQHLVRHQSGSSDDSEYTNMDDDDDIMPAQALPELTLGEHTANTQSLDYYMSPNTVISTSSMAAIELSPPSTSTTNPGSMLLPFQRAQPVDLAATNSVALSPLPTHSININNNNTSETARRHHHHQRHQHTHNLKNKPIGASSFASRAEHVHVDESIISLLLKLHSQLSGTLDSFSLDTTTETSSTDPSMEVDDNDPQAGPSSRPSTSPINTSQPQIDEARDRSRIGDGPYFIAKLLHKIIRLDRSSVQTINEIRERTWPNQRERMAEQAAFESREKEERSKRAKDRQQKLMEEFAKKQKKFMEMASKGMDGAEPLDADNDLPEDGAAFEEKPREKEYVCIICNNTSASTETNPIGLVVLVESSGVVGHRRRQGERFVLPLCDDDKRKYNPFACLRSESSWRTFLLERQYGRDSWFLSMNMVLEPGVHVQTCGHHVHLTCHESYLNTLYTSQRHQNLNVVNGEFSCPVCRQLSNSVLPLSPQLDRPQAVIRMPTPPFAEVAQELVHLIRDNERPSVSDLNPQLYLFTMLYI